MGFFKRCLAISFLAFILYSVLATGFFFEIISEKNWLTEDFVAQNFPNRFYADKEIRNGFLPLWNPHNFSGIPFQADIQTGVFYPFNLALSLFPQKELIDFFRLYQIQIIFHFILAAYFTFIFLRKLDLNFVSSFLGGAIYSFSGFFFSHAHHSNMVHSGIWLPAILYCCLKGFKDDFRWIWVCPFILSISLFGGHPQMTLFIIYFFSLFYIFLSWRDSSHLGIHLLRFFMIVLTFFLLGAVQILPTAEFLNQTVRSSMDFSSAVTDSLPLNSLWTFLLPNWNLAEYQTWQWWEFRNYLSSGAILLAIWGTIRSLKGMVLFFSIIGGLALMLSFGSNTPIYKLFYDFAPGFSYFRVPARFIMIFTFCVSVLAAYGLSPVSVDVRKIILKKWVYTAILLLAIPFLAPIPEKLPSFMVKAQLINCFLILSAIFLLGLLKRKYQKWDLGFSVCILLVVLADLYTYRPLFNQQSISKEIFANSISENVVSQAVRGQTSEHRFLIRKKTPIFTNWGPVYGFFNIWGYNPFKLETYSQLNIGSNKTLNLLGVRFTDDFTPENLVKKFPNKKQFLIKNKFLVNEAAFPRAFFVTESRTQENFDLQKAIDENEFNPRAVVYLDAKPELTQLDAVPSSYDISNYDNKGGRISLELHTNNKGFLVLTDVFYQGWKASINGEGTPVLKADSVFRAIEIDNAINRVELWFRPISFVIGAWVSGFTFLMLIFLSWYKPQFLKW